MSLLSKVVQLGSQGAFIALAVRYLGVDKYGIWMTVVAFFGFFGLSTFGIGPGLVNALAETNGREDTEGAKSLFSTAFFFMLGISTILAVGYFSVFPFVNWASIANIPVQDSLEVSTLFALCAVLTFLQFPLSLVEAAYAGYQETYLSYIWQIAAQFLSIVGLFVAVTLKLNLPTLVLFYSGSSSLVTLASGVWLVIWHRPYLMPSTSALRMRDFRRLMRSASGFFLMTLAGLVVTQLVTLLIAHRLGPNAVASYSIVWRMIMLTNGMVSMFAVPLWAAYGEARTRLDWNWILVTHKKLIHGTISFAFLSFGLLALTGQVIIRYWAGAQAVPPSALLVIMCMYGYFQAINTVNGALVSGFDKVLRQGGVAVTEASIAVIACNFLLASFGLDGIALGLLLTTLTISTPFLYYQARQICKKMQHAGES